LEDLKELGSVIARGKTSWICLKGGGQELSWKIRLKKNDLLLKSVGILHWVKTSETVGKQVSRNGSQNASCKKID